MNKISINYLLKLLSIALLLFSFSQAQAKRVWRPNNSSPVVITVVNNRGVALNQYTADNRQYRTKRAYLEAKKGGHYKIKIRNTSNKRIGVVIAVDGRNILNGKKSYLRSNEKMYVLDPYETSTYKGWRTKKNHINRFYFTSAGDSYSNAWGDRSAMGVIAVAVFNEKPKQYRKKYNKYQPELSNRMAPSARANRRFQADESTGTGFGREEYSPTRRVSFKAQTQPRMKHFLKYEWRNTLCKKRIINCGYERPQNNNRFWPNEREEYAPYPPNWNNNYRNW